MKFFIVQKSTIENLFWSVGPVVTCLTILLYYGFYFLDFAPFYSDELHYWNEINNLKTVGLNSGYSVINEQPAKIKLSPFGPHGLGFPIAGSIFAYFFGWKPYSPIIFNSVVFSLALLVFFISVPTNRTQRFLVSGFLSTSFFVVNFLASGMQESINQSFGIILALMILRELRHTSSSISYPYSSWIRPFQFLFLCAATAIRSSWGLILPVILFQLGREKSRERHKWILNGVALLIIIFALLLMVYVYSPVTKKGQIAFALEFFSTLKLEFLFEFVHVTFKNLLGFLLNGTLIEGTLRYEFLAITAYLCCLLRSKKNNSLLTSTEKSIAKIAIIISFFSILAVVSLYEIGSWRDYRVLAPSFVCVFVLAVFIKRCHFFLMALIFLQIIMLYSILPTFRDFREKNFLGTSVEEIVSIKATKAIIRFVPQKNKWCNTMLFFSPDQPDSVAFRNLWISVPGGIGVSTVHNIDTLEFPLRSRYIFLSKRGFDQLLVIGLNHIDIAPLYELGPEGVIYENLSIKCES